MTSNRFSAKVFVLTGATGGLGNAMAHRLAQEGATLVLTDISKASCADLVAQLPSREKHLVAELNVANESAWEALVGEIRGADLAVDGLINNAGVGSIATVEEEEEANWNNVMSIDVNGVWLGMKHIGPLIEQNGGGSIVNIGSILGTVGGLGNSAAYSAAKGAVRTLTKNAALNWATRGVRINSVHPGFIETPQLLERYGGSERHKFMLANTPMGRLGKPQEIAGVVAFLLSDDSKYMTGSEVYADGGFTAR